MENKAQGLNSVFGHKKAIGALRYIEDKAYAAGIAVYHFETGEVTQLPILFIDHVFVGKAFRQKGVGNHLMVAAIIQTFL